MATNLLDLGQVQVTRFCGPSTLDNRVCYQIDGPERVSADGTPAATFVCLTQEQAFQVASALRQDIDPAGAECEQRMVETLIEIRGFIESQPFDPNWKDKYGYARMAVLIEKAIGPSVQR